ncbi:response regulator transcription factor [Salinibacillus xinjiangensis]|uniref:response regulator transcription factor n=1 Tax=Salinibacillus xinjiangensis TaxID=1229268 RepID=UPI0018912F31|nr:response regulator [Salinibacillus xinjiangensis]
MKALIVDDEAHVREAIEYLIDWDKFNITERLFAGSVVEAEELIAEHYPEILFCDIKMPEQNGIHLIETLKKEKVNIQVVVISGYDDFEYMRAVIQANAVDYILKPIKKEEIEKALKQAIKNWQETESFSQFQKIVEIDEKEQTKESSSILEIKNYLDGHFHERITLDILAKKFYLSPQYISNRFKAQYGISIVEYVTKLKIEKAKQLLMKTSKSILDIAYELGFSNENYFSKVFKKYVQLSPKNYREKYVGKKNG